MNAELVLQDFANQPTIAPDSAVVTSGVEFLINSGTYTVDVGEDYIKMKISNSATQTAAFSRQLVISDMDWTNAPSAVISGRTLSFGTDWEYGTSGPTGISESDVTFTDHSVSIQWGNDTYWPRGSWVRVDLTCSEQASDPELSIADVSADEGVGTMSFTVSLFDTSSSNITVDYLTSGISATTGVDFTSTTGTLTIPAGQSSGQISVPIIDDAWDEGDESFLVILTSATSATISDNQGTGTIQDNDPTPTISIGDASADEGAGTMSFTVSLAGLSDAPITVDYSAADGSAVSTQDYTGIMSTLAIPPHQSSGIITVAITDDAVDEPDETFLVNLTGTSGATLADSQATGTILDNDDPPVMSISNASGVVEGGLSLFTVTLSQASTQEITVRFSTADGSALASHDYTARIDETLTFAPGEISHTIEVATLDDSMDEPEEGFTVGLSNPTNATLGDDRGGCKIQDNDDEPDLYLSNAHADEGDGVMNIIVTLSMASGRQVSVLYYTSDVEAVAPEDYTAVADTLVIPAGVINAFIEIPIMDDTVDEPNETLVLYLINPAFATLKDFEAIGAIEDNDEPPLLSMGDVSVDEDAGSVTLSATLSAVSAKEIVVDYNTIDGTAAAPDDYTASSGSLTIPAGQQSITIDIPVIDDGVDELDEIFTVNLSDPVNATLGDGIGQVTIFDNDVVLTLVSNSGGSVSVPGEGPYTFDEGTLVDITATAAAHYHFVEWVGPVEDPCSTSTRVAVTENMTIEAVFSIDQFNVILSSSMGGDIVDPCEGKHLFDYEQKITLCTEIDDPLFEFSHYEGNLWASYSPYHYTVKGQARIRAIFHSVLDVLYVDANVPEGQYENGTDEYPFNTIQETIEVAAPGTTIVIRRGTYVENLDLSYKSLTLTGVDVNDVNDWSFPLIQGAGDGPVVTVNNVSDSNTLLQGLVISQGDGRLAGGFSCRQSQLALANCLFVGNRCDTIHGQGGAFSAYESQVDLINCTFSGNYGGRTGATLYADSNSVITLCDSILWDNEPNEFYSDATSEIIMQYCNLDINPNFVAPGDWEHALNAGLVVTPSHAYAIWREGDYHLDVNSPCIDAGDPNAVYDLESEPNGDYLNLGAYGNTPQAAVSPVN